MLPIKKIYVDSRFKTSPTESHSDFHIELPMTLLMPEDTGFYIEDVCIPHTWYPVNANNNYLQFNYLGIVAHIVIAPGNYSVRGLNDALFEKINQTYEMGTLVAADYDAKTNSIGIKLTAPVVGATFKLYTDDEITLPENRKRSMNGLLKNFSRHDPI